MKGEHLLFVFCNIDRWTLVFHFVDFIFPWLESGGKESSKSFVEFVDDEVLHETFVKAKRFVKNCNMVRKFLLEEGMKRKGERVRTHGTKFKKVVVQEEAEVVEEVEELWNRTITTMGGANGDVEVRSNDFFCN